MKSISILGGWRILLLAAVPLLCLAGVSVGAAGGAVFGPSTSTLNAIATYADQTGKLIKDNPTIQIAPNGDFSSVFSRELTGLDDFVFPFSLDPMVTPLVDSTGYLYSYRTRPTVLGNKNFGGLYGAQSIPTMQSTGSLADGIYGTSSEPLNLTGTSIPRIYGFSSYPTSWTGNIGEITGFYNRTTLLGNTTLGVNYGAYLAAPRKFHTSSIIDNYGLKIAYHNQGSNSNYAFWYDSPGVYRINGEGVMAYYNPQFIKYTPGAMAFERIIQQWNANVAQYGVEAGTQGGTLRKLQLVGGGLILSTDILPTSDPHVAGQLWNSNGALMVSGG